MLSSCFPTPHINICCLCFTLAYSRVALNSAVFTPPFGNNTLKRLSMAIPDLTSLPTLVVPRLQKPAMPMLTITVPEVGTCT
jgi:hypothetical protein